MEKPKKREKLTTNAFYHYADQLRKRLIEEEEIEKIDMTDEFFKELEKTVKNKELINMNINAPPASGKSLTGMAIAKRILRKCFKRKMGIKDIDRDQQEFSQTLRRKEVKRTVRVIDEWNELETTGENSSIEEALYNYFSDVMAQRFVHKISCSPTSAPDKNALIFLEVISTDKTKEVNHCKLYYKIMTGGMEIRQLIGIVRIEVGEVLREEWYKEYRRRKFEKMNLILEEGIFRPRILKYAGVILSIVERLRKLTRMPEIINVDIIRNYVKSECRKAKIPQSIVGEELATREVNGILRLWISYYKTLKAIENKRGRMEKLERKGVTSTRMKEDIEELETMRDEIANNAAIQEEELKHYKEIDEKYNKKLG